MQTFDLGPEELASIDIALCPYARVVSAKYEYPDDPTTSNVSAASGSILPLLQPILQRIQAGGAPMTVAEAMGIVSASGSTTTYGATLKAQRILDLEVRSFHRTWTGAQDGNTKISELILEAKAWAGAPCVPEEPET